MKILMLVNWKVETCETKPVDKQPPDYYIKQEPYWFFRYFQEKPDVDVVDISSFPWLERVEKNKLRFYIWQTLRVLPSLDQYDLVLSHGAQSGIVLSLLRRVFKTKAKHIVFDIGSFNSAAESGLALKLMQMASKSIDGLIYHTSSQLDYYRQFYPWLVSKSRFIPFGTDLHYFDPAGLPDRSDKNTYIICVGASKRDWDTLVKAYQMLHTDVKLRLVGKINEKYVGVEGMEQLDHVPVNELIEQIHNSLFAVLPLEQFNYSYGQMTLMQQMALEKCVVAARVNSLVDYANDGDTVVFYTPCDAEDLAKKLDRTLSDETYRADIARAGRLWLQERCCEPIMAKEIENFIAEVLS